MGSENRQTRRDRARQRRRHSNEPPLSQVEFPGIMGWMQRNGRVLFLLGIVFMILSVGGAAFAGGLTPDADPEPVPTETAEPSSTGEATPTEEVINRTYAAEPAMALDEGVDYQAVIHLENGGAVTIDLLEDDAPGYVNNFVFLAQNRFYEGLTFHRVLPGFVAQAGDPLGTGNGGPGYFLTAESNDIDFERGALSMAKSSLGVSGSQFFITTGPTPHLNNDFTVFGWVTEGMDVVDALMPRDPAAAGAARGDVIADIEIVETEKAEAPAGEATPEATATAEGEATGTPEATATPTATP
ncbi:MAG: peptidylprolyl isomerase [Dehalococcoidia bacterium]|nr:peptidylprolyl isomerase [Dehalococcoidia bacterium]